MKNFWTRTISAVVYVVLFLGSLYCYKLPEFDTIGRYIFFAFLTFVACGCTFEFFRIVGQQDATPNRPLGYVFTVLALIAVACNWLELCFVLLPVAFGLAAILQLWKHSSQPFRDAAYTVLPMLYAGIPLGMMPWLHYTNNIMVMVLIMVWTNDNCAYMGGSLLGKHKMWMRHSPGKTWEGTVIGVAATLLVAALVGPLFNSTLSWPVWLLLGFVCSVVSTLGDLVESMLKRSVGMKDSGKIMPGHGGFLDRFDSLLIATPICYAFIYIVNMLW